MPSESLLNVTSAIAASNVSRFAKNSYMASSTETNLAPPTLIGLTIGILSLYMINTGNSCRFTTPGFSMGLVGIDFTGFSELVI